MTTQIPVSAEAEFAVLVSLCRAPDRLDRIDELAAMDFGSMLYVEEHLACYNAIVALLSDRVDITHATLRDKLGREGNEIIELADAIYQARLAEDIEPAITLVKQAAEKRLMQQLFQKAYFAVTDSASSMDEILENVLREYSRQDKEWGCVSSDLTETTKSFLDDYESIMEGRIPIQRTGIRRLDYLTKGMRGGQMILLVSPPGQGKSALALNIAFGFITRVLDFNRVVLVVSLEMSRVEYMQRAVSAWTRIPLDVIVDPEQFPPTKDQLHQIMQATEDLRKLKLEFVEPPHGMTAQSIERIARHLRRRYGRLDMIVVDYLQLLSSPSGAQGFDAVSSNARSLKLLARTLNVPLVVLQAINREGMKMIREGHNPDLHHVSYAGDRDADQVWFITDPSEEMDPTKRKIVVAKVRQGMRGVVDVSFQGSIMSFANRDDDYEQPQQQVQNEPREQNISTIIDF